MFDKKCRYCPPEYGCLLMVVRGTWNFVRHPATLAQGSASEAHMNMDVNLCRLPDLTKYVSKFLVPLAVIMWHPHPADSDGIRSKQAERQFTIKKNMQLRIAGISLHISHQCLKYRPFQIKHRFFAITDMYQ